MRVPSKAACAVASIGLMTLGASQTHAADCDFNYIIQEGDTLASIATLAYGSANYQLIYSANIGLVRNPADLPTGETLLIPCIPGEGGLVPDDVALSMAMLKFSEEESAEAAEAEADETASATAEETPAEEPSEDASEVAASEDAEPVAEDAATPAEEPAPETVVATAAPATRALDPVGDVNRLRLLTANGQAPFADQSLRGGGMATELAAMALGKIGIAEPSKIVFIDDRGSHLQDLLIDGSFDLGFPWFRPACDQIDQLEELSPENAWLCQNFIFSEPFYEFVYGFFVRSGEYSAARASFEDFDGARICRPQGRSVLDLAVNGLTEDNAEYVRPETLAECFALLKAEEVDAVSGEAFEAENIMAEMNLYDDVEELSALSILQTVHAVAPISKPSSDDAIASFNKGLVELKVSGEWFRIVGRHLAQN